MPENPMEKTYLKYIETFLRAKEPNAHLFRTFVDNWFAYHTGGPFLNSRGRAKWFNNPDPVSERSALLQMHWISQSAQNVLNGKEIVHLVKDHAIPLLVLRNRMFQFEEWTLNSIRQFLIENYKLGLITIDEDNKINKSGLRQKMPERTADPVWMSRYLSAGLLRVSTTSTT